MSTPYICLRCRQQLSLKRWHARRLSFVSLSQTIRKSDENQPTDRSQDDSRLRKPISKRQRPAPRASRPPLGLDSSLEALFSARPGSQQEPLLTKYSAGSSDQVDQGYGQRRQRHKVIDELQQQENRAAKDIEGTEPSLQNTGSPSSTNAGTSDSSDLERQPKFWDDNWQARSVTTIIKNLERAIQRYDVAWVTQLWQKYQQSSTNVDLDQNSQETIYIHFLSAFFTLSRQELAIQVWNDMLQANITPNERHWNAMLKGCTKVHDGRSLQGVWNSMIAAGVEPDQALWTSYIYGLIMCGKWQRGLNALDDLGAKWKTGSKSQKPIVKGSIEGPRSGSNPPPDYDPKKPSLVPVQAALTALTVTQRQELCLPLLNWAKSHSLTLTTEIFNILLQPAVRNSDTKSVAHIFSLMNANKCSADEATYTILLNGHMSSANSNFSFLSPHEQWDSIRRILDDMTANKIAIDRRTYGTILQSLLMPERGTPNSNGARALLEHMSKNNINPDSYIYHMLVTYHFAQPSPDLAAIESIWARIKVERPNLQSVFYEKMVEGYARVKAVERMMFFLKRIAREGNSPRWRCLTEVLRTLIEVGDWGLVKELVDDVKDTRTGLMRYADNNLTSTSKEDFWAIVEGVKDRLE